MLFREDGFPDDERCLPQIHCRTDDEGGCLAVRSLRGTGQHPDIHVRKQWEAADKDFLQKNIDKLHSFTDTKYRLFLPDKAVKSLNL